MTHLSPDELKRWFERGQADDRERVIAHLADCGECRKMLSAMASAAESVESAPALTVSEAVPRGYAARTPARDSSSWLAWFRPAYGLAAFAVVIVAAAFWVARPAPGTDDGIRSAELLAVSPAGTGSATEFRWESPFDVPRYRITIAGASGAVVHVVTVASSPWPLDDDTKRRLTAGAVYSWRVEALDAAGDVVATSRPSAFRFTPQ